MYDEAKAQLPTTELGSERCLQMEYYGHGDIAITSWSGPLDINPDEAEAPATRFNMRHGCDLLLLAACVGYLRRFNTPEEEIQQTVLAASQEIIAEDLGDLRYHSYTDTTIKRVSVGAPFPRYDMPDLSLTCLMPLEPSQPGLAHRVGGTAIYTKPNGNKTGYLVYASHVPVPREETTEIAATTEFCKQDIPTIASLICEMALGEYRRDLKKYIETNFHPST